MRKLLLYLVVLLAGCMVDGALPTGIDSRYGTVCVDTACWEATHGDVYVEITIQNPNPQKP